MRIELYLPAILATLLALSVLLATVSYRANRVMTRLSIVTFAEYLNVDSPKSKRHSDALRRAQFPTTYRIYGAKTVLYTTIGALVGIAVGIYVSLGIMRFLSLPPETIRSELPPVLHFLDRFVGVPVLSSIEQAALLITVCMLSAAAVAAAMYWVRWWYPAHVGRLRRKKIEANLPQAVAFMYALSRSGMELPKVMRILSNTEHVYGAAAAEFTVAVREMELFGKDVVSAIGTMGQQTPSPQFKEFCENLTSVLQSGQSLAGFLEKEHESFKEEAEAQQEALLNELATLAEAYVTILVAGPLFLITMLVVIGIAITDTLSILRLAVYLLLPIANVGFIVYLNSVTGESTDDERFEELRRPVDRSIDVRRTEDGTVRSDGGAHSGGAMETTQRENVAKVRLHRQIRWLRNTLGNPLQTLLERPVTVLWVTIPLTIVVTILRLYWSVTVGVPVQVVIDDFLIQAALFVLGTFALVYEVHRRRIETIEAAVPDFMDRLASVNEAGMTVVESIGRVRKGELGALNEELDRVWRDLQWGADVTAALRRFEARIRTRTISRTVTLITHAMNASGDLARVLRIAALQAKADRRLKRARKQEMITYVVVVYVAFAVFLVIIAALDLVLLPSLPDDTTLPETTGSAGQLGVGGVLDDIGSVNETAYTLVFFHTTVLQSLFSGLIAGQMSGGSIKDGAKHAAVLLSISYLMFLFL